MAFSVSILIQFSTRDRARRFRSGLGDVTNIIAVCLNPETFWTIGGVDAFYLGLTRAERWGSRPLPPHQAAILETSSEDRGKGLPPYIITGLVLKDDEPNDAKHGIPLLAHAIDEAICQANAKQAGLIRTIGFFEFELEFRGISIEEIGRLFADSFGRKF
jgi:hypothetical protein